MPVVPFIPAIIGGVAALAGSKKQSDATKDAANTAANAAAYNPYNVAGPWGNVNYDTANKSVSGTYSPEMEQFRSLFGNQAMQYLNGNSPSSGFQNFANQIGQQQLPGLFNQAVDQAGYMPTAEYSQAMGLFNQDHTSLMNDRLNMLRQQAAPYEQRMLDSVAQSAFGRGQLGGPGGRLALEQYGNAISAADLGRQMEAQNLGLQAQTNNLNTGNAIFGTASNMSNLANSRAQQRLQNATGLFGFGNELGQQDFNQGQGYFGNMTGMDSQMLQYLALGGNIGGQQANAGANQGQFYMQNSGSPGGAFLSSLGNNIFSQWADTWKPGQKPQPVAGADQPGSYTPGQVG